MWDEDDGDCGVWWEGVGADFELAGIFEEKF